MADRKDGGPAFAHGSPEHGGDSGLSKRDYFAGQALAGELVKSSVPELHLENWFPGKTAITREQIIARGAYMIADAMLAEREKSNG